VVLAGNIPPEDSPPSPSRSRISAKAFVMALTERCAIAALRSATARSHASDARDLMVAHSPAMSQILPRSQTVGQNQIGEMLFKSIALSAPTPERAQ